MKLVITILFAAVSLFAVSRDSLKIEKTNFTAERINEKIEIDGKLTEQVWQNGNGVSGFFQRDPEEGAEPTEKTIARFAFDDAALYIGVKLFDSAPDSIVANLSRRDLYIPSDRVTIYIDSYNDKRSGFYFALNAAGILYDGVVYNDTWSDNSWDGVWEGKVNIDDEGWSAEFRIPFSQLKFNNQPENIWGINIKREIARKNEVIFSTFVPKRESGFVSHFGELSGIKNITPPRHFELLPYVTAKAEYTNPAAGNPFNKGSNYSPGFGADLRTSIGSNLTLNATVFPDFGQVEIDPAVINLSDVETYFSEKRPFFVEGSTIFNFGQGGARNYWGFNWGGATFFYSRRIGRTPQGPLPANEFSSRPEGTNILGAAKLTGKLNESWNIGIIQSVTAREYADYQYSDDSFNKIISEAEIEPLTYYGIFRAQKEINNSHAGLGFISTISQRNFKDDRLRDYVNSGSYTGGMDGWIFLDSSRTWVFAGWGGVSHIAGNEKRMIAVQRNSQHYFQRPDADYLNVDSSAASLTGYAGRFVLNKQKGNFFVNSAFGFIDPNFNVNDAGFMWRADQINYHVGAGYNWSEPTAIYRSMEHGLAFYQVYDFGGNRTGTGIFNFGYLQLNNYYSGNWNISYTPETINNRRTWGGPLTLNPQSISGNIWLRSDDRKKIVVGTGSYGFSSKSGYDYGIDLDLQFKPASNVNFSFRPGIEKNRQQSQWVGAFDDPAAVNTFGKRYVFAELDQTTVSAGIRMNWTFNPGLSLQLYVQPLISAGNYYNYKELLHPKTYDFLLYGEGNSTFNGETLEADADGPGPAKTIALPNLNFNFISLRGNAVLRWEYLPGSVLFLVWTQSRADFEMAGDFRFNHSISKMIDAKADNIFMLKFTYWFNM
jgi:hypothetical protein